MWYSRAYRKVTFRTDEKILSKTTSRDEEDALGLEDRRGRPGIPHKRLLNTISHIMGETHSETEKISRYR